MTTEENLKLAVRLALAALERVIANYGQDLHIIDPEDEDRIWSLDDWIAEWGIQGTINELQDALKGKTLEL